MEHLLEYDEYIKSLLKDLPGIIKGIEIVTISEKSSERDLVTEVDQGVEKFLTDKIKEKFPTHTILGEETFIPDTIYDKKNLWVIDPIDGTTNFVKQKNDYCTLISYFEEGEPVLSYIYEVEKDDLYHSMKGHGVYLNNQRLENPENKSLFESLVSTDIRRMYLHKNDLFTKLVEESFGLRSIGTSGLDGSRVLSGRTGAYLNYSGGPWDFAPFYLMAKELDLVFVDLEGNEVSLDSYSGFIICTKKVFEDYKKVLKLQSR